jgi:hypothetical protein
VHAALAVRTDILLAAGKQAAAWLVVLLLLLFTPVCIYQSDDRSWCSTQPGKE